MTGSDAATLVQRITVAAIVLGGFTWVLFLPVSHNEILYPVFGLIGLTAIIALARRNPSVDVHLWVIAFLVGGLAVFGMLRGVDNPDVVFFAIYVAAPAMYLACAAAATLRTLRYVVIAAVVATIALSVVLLVFVAGEAGLIPQVVPDWVVAHLDLKATFRAGSSQARSWGLSSLAALGPLWMASLFAGRHPLLPPWGVRLICVLLALGTAAVSNRTAILLVTLIAPVIALVLRITLLRTRAKPIWRPHPFLWIPAAVVAAIGAVLLLPRLLSSGPVASLLASIGSFFGLPAASGEDDQSIRSDQAWHLLDAWAANPILGAGFRASVPDYARTSENTWSLELQYHLLLFQVGLVGVAIAIAAVVAGLLYVRAAVIARPDFTPVLLTATTGAVAMIVANATNPYLQAPGHQWALFLPLAVATVALHHRRPRTPVDPGDAQLSTVELSDHHRRQVRHDPAGDSMKHSDD